MNGPVQPPRSNPPSGSSRACPGAWMTPSSETYSIAISFLMVVPAFLLLATRQAPAVGSRPVVAQGGQGVVEAALPRLWGLGVLERVYQAALLGFGEPVGGAGGLLV